MASVAWFFALLSLVLLGTLYDMRLIRRRLERSLRKQIASLAKQVDERTTEYQCVYERMHHLSGFVATFMQQQHVDAELRRRAEKLNGACRQAIEDQADPDAYLEALGTRDREIRRLKNEFWEMGVKSVKLANEALGGLKQFRVPESHKEFLGDPTA